MTTPNISPQRTENPPIYLTESTSQEAVHTTAEKVSGFTLPAMAEINSPIFVHLPTLQEPFPSFNTTPSSFRFPSPMSEDPSAADLIPDFPVQPSIHLHDDSDEEGKGSPPKKTKFASPSRALQLSSPPITPVRRPRPAKLGFSSPQTPSQGPILIEVQDSDSEGENVFSSPPKKGKFDSSPSLTLPALSQAQTQSETLGPARLHFLDEIASVANPEPARPALVVQPNFTQELDKTAFPVVKNGEEFHWMNRLVQPRVLGRDLNEREKLFVQQVYEAVGMGHTFPYSNVKLGIQHLQRGTYFIRHMHSALFELLSKPTVAKCIAEYYSRDRTSLETLLNANISPVGVFKPADEVRGAPNEKKGRNNPAKEGVKPELEIIQDVAAAGLFPLNQVVVGMSLTDPNFYDRATNDAGRKAKTKFGAAISFLPMTSLDKVADKDVLDRALSTLPIEDFQDITILDISLCNADRNIGNMMLSTEALARFTNSQPGVNPSLQHGELCPIDHANILPAGFASPGNFAWMDWKIAHQPYTESAKRKIASLNAQEDIAKMRQLYPNYPEENLEILEITYNLLKEAAVSNFTPFQIGLLFAAENETPSFLMSLFLTAKDLQASMPPESRPSMSDLMMPCIMKGLAYATKYDLNNTQEAWDASFSDVMRKAKDVLKK